MKVLNAYSKFLDVLTKILRAILIVLLASMVIIMIYNVICRYIFSDAKPWAEELTLYISIFSIMLGLGIASRSDSHLQVDFLTRLYKPKVRCLMAAIWSVVTIVIMAIFAYYSVSLIPDAWTCSSAAAQRASQALALFLLPQDNFRRDHHPAASTRPLGS